MDSGGSTGELYQTLKEEIYNLYQKIERERNSQLILWDLTLRTNKKIKQNTSKLNPEVYKRDKSLQPSGVNPRNASIVQYLKIKECNLPY